MAQSSVGHLRNACGLLLLFALMSVACAQTPINGAGHLKEWIKGVWITGNGTYTIYTDDHYFVVSVEGDSAHANVYCGASQLKFTNKGMARLQVLRVRHMPGGEQTTFNRAIFQPDHTETPMVIDSTLFTPGSCNIVDGVIYDAITEVTDEYILISTCNGDKEKIFSNGVYVYMPEGGGEFYSYRIARL